MFGRVSMNTEILMLNSSERVFSKTHDNFCYVKKIERGFIKHEI